jgi:uncharacterized protein
MSAAQAKAADPSMEEILASIRRIISDEPQKAPAASAPANASAVEPAPAAVPTDDGDDEIMELTPKPKAKAKEPHFITDDPVGNDVSFDDGLSTKPKSQEDIDALMDFDAPAPPPVAPPAPPPAPPVMRMAEPPQPRPSMPEPFAPEFQTPPHQAREPLAAPADRLISPDTDRVASTAFSSLASTILTRNARTLEDLMQDMMRPMIKAWLDDNLPIVVERLVKAEIERVARGGR